MGDSGGLDFVSWVLMISMQLYQSIGFLEVLYGAVVGWVHRLLLQGFRLMWIRIRY